MAEISATNSSSRELAAACADQVANFDIILRQFVENISGRVASPAKYEKTSKANYNKGLLASKEKCSFTQECGVCGGVVEIGAPTRAAEQEHRERGRVDPPVAARLGTEYIGYSGAADQDSAST